MTVTISDIALVVADDPMKRVSDFLDGIDVSPTLLDRFWAHTQMGAPDECWNWTGACTAVNKKYARPGYGVVHAAYVNGKQVQLTTHRLSWLLHCGPIPDGMFVCHHCDNSLCVNPAHLFLGTAADNTHDMMQKGRNNPPRKVTADVLREFQELRNTTELANDEIAARFGVHRNTMLAYSHGQRKAYTKPSKLTSEQVDAIIAEYATGKTSYSKLARKYGIDQSYISYLIHGKRRNRRVTQKDNAQ